MKRLLVVLLLLSIPFALGAQTPEPNTVTIAGSLQEELGCPGDWQPECASTQLTLDAADGVWQGTFDVPAGSWEYKAALNGTWDENYGANAAPNGGNIALNLTEAGAVKFYYDHETHWVADNRSKVIAVAPGSFQSELGCPGDWQPDCLQSWLQDPDGDGLYTFSTSRLPAGDYEVKVAINESWAENYGADGVRDGANITFNVPTDCTEVMLAYDPATHRLTVSTPALAPPQPTSVVIPGSFQEELGCSGDWQPDCAQTALTLDENDGVWQGTFNVPAGSWEYKAALDGTWDVNYGANATLNGGNIGLTLAEAAAVKFYYDHKTHWVADDHSKVIAVAPGSFQSELGCSGDWQPDCLRSWLKDTDGDGIYDLTVDSLPAGNYEVKVAIDESWTENYGAGGARDGANIAFSVPSACTPIYFRYDPSTHVLTVSAQGAPQGNISRARAHWVTSDLILFDVSGLQPNWVVTLHHDPEGDLELGAGGVTGGTDIQLTHDPAGIPDVVLERFPHLAGFEAFRIAPAQLAQVSEILKGQLALSVKTAAGDVVDATGLQIPGVLDALYANNVPLGVTFLNGVPTVRVWAPTARSVKLFLYDDANPDTQPFEVPMTLSAGTGVWSATGTPAWYGKFYLYEVEVFVPSTGQVELNRVTDPYSVSLSTNSQRSQIIDLNDPALKPVGWDQLTKPALAAPEDIVLYELHVRDFSAYDPSVPEPLKGTFKAFTLGGSNGVGHLSSLAAAGLTHVHLLPSFDFATVNEDRSQWQEPEGDLASFAPDSPEQQARVNAVRDTDAFNWGYDPWHFTVPEGSYSTDPNGATRILEFREMVKSLSERGLRVVMDVVYNHTTASGQSDRSVLDRIVPGYYHRLNADGQVERSTCCENTASEHFMMEKLMIDSLLTWATAYKVDGFRFDLMGHHMKRNLVAIRETLDSLTPENSGVDGSDIYLYGEGWNFGEVANDARGENATQLNMAGTGIGTFSDRLRDGARGGGPFSGLREQGFLTGLYTDPNSTDQGTPDAQRERLLLYTDWIRIGMVGNLADYLLIDRNSQVVAGKDIDYNGQPAGYTSDPQEVITYVEAHDNETLFDAIQLKAPEDATAEERLRMQMLGMSVVGFGQGIPFFHAGVELLRSKSLDRNSYNSGDWFNKLDFTRQWNNWGAGLPPAGDNQANWPIMQPLLANENLAVGSDEIDAAYDHFREVLAIRKSSPLFRLRTEAEIIERVKHYNTGSSQIPGFILMSITDDEAEIDREHSMVVVAINAGDETVTYEHADFAARNLTLHPLQADGDDSIESAATFEAGEFSIPARTAAVFWEARSAESRIGRLMGEVDALDLKQERGLLTKLEQALDRLVAGQNTAAVNQLYAFIGQLDALMNAGLLSREVGTPLIREADAIVREVCCN